MAINCNTIICGRFKSGIAGFNAPKTVAGARWGVVESLDRYQFGGFMRFGMWILSALLVTSSLVQAAQSKATLNSNSTSKTTIKKKDYQIRDVNYKGLRVGLIRPFVDFRASVAQNDREGHLRSAIDQTTGVSVGYAFLPAHRIGFTTNFAWMELEDDGDTMNLMRQDANIAYSVIPMLNVKGGVNLSLVTAHPVERYEHLYPMPGAQASVGMNITRDIAVDLGWVYMMQKRRLDGADVEFRQAGLEFGVNGTFF
jgi:hypothetical protein